MAVDLVVSETGAGPPLVILHGLFGSRRNWTSVASVLGRHHRVVTVDLRNHGESPWDERMDYPALAEDVAVLIDSVAGGMASVCGHSMGGKVAMTLALTAPERIDRLVVVDIPPAASRGTSIDLVRAMRAVPLAECSRRADAATALAATVPDPAIRSFLAQSVAVRPEGLAWSVNLAVIEREFETILGFPDLAAGNAFTKPTLFIAGGRSAYLRPRHWPEIQRFFPAATLEVVEEAGHWVHADAPQAFTRLVERFLGA